MTARDHRPPFVPATLAFAAFMADEELRRDLATLVRLGGVQRRAREAGCDSPSGWFGAAAAAYPFDGQRYELARRALRMVGEQLGREVPS